MKKILRFLGTGYNKYYQAHVKIYDNNYLVYSGYTYNGIIKCNLKRGCYYMEAKTNYGLISKKIIIVDNINEYTFVFNYAIINNTNNIITFLLTDYNYANLPIKKGDIYLWQKQ